MEVVNVEEPICAVRISQYPDDKKNEFLILGRSNVGKSSFINTIINRKNMAKTSSKPGKTQTINFYHINSQFYIVDVPGYGYAQTSKKQIEKFYNDEIINKVNLKFKEIGFKYVTLDLNGYKMGSMN